MVSIRRALTQVTGMSGYEGCNDFTKGAAQLSTPVGPFCFWWNRRGEVITQTSWRLMVRDTRRYPPGGGRAESWRDRLPTTSKYNTLEAT